ncbi:hypothetical protein OIU85_002827 [Salix viminalis]|uniref:Uncharacterized protein n=1 Tax=Salix viminalis TaxID=40686 RepID=A0A9Q0ZZ95_SALVM|nr:hypothetical protein OIU85_002827 [Salix viminalis]
METSSGSSVEKLMLSVENLSLIEGRTDVKNCQFFSPRKCHLAADGGSLPEKIQETRINGLPLYPARLCQLDSSSTTTVSLELSGDQRIWAMDGIFEIQDCRLGKRVLFGISTLRVVLSLMREQVVSVLTED